MRNLRNFPAVEFHDACLPLSSWLFDNARHVLYNNEREPIRRPPSALHRPPSGEHGEQERQ